MTLSKESWFSSGEIRLPRENLDISREVDPTASGPKGPASVADLRRALLSPDLPSFLLLLDTLLLAL